MLENIFDYDISKALDYLDFNGLYELRIRVDKPCIVNYYNKLYYLGNSGLTGNLESAIVLNIEQLQNVIIRASNYSIYKVNEELKKGYITLDGGIRLGVCGEAVYENEKLSTIKNFTSINLRFPHEVKGIGKKIIDYLIDTAFNFLNTIIISPPGVGKTTLLRDLIRELCSINHMFNTLVVDERNEITATNNGVSKLDLGTTYDVIIYDKKANAINNGIRAMSPDIIATDEIGTSDDVFAIQNACNSGVKILTTLHGQNENDLLQKTNFKTLIDNKTFKRYIVLSNRKGKGTIEKILDENFKIIYGEKM